MTTIVEFLTARLDEDQAIATAAKWKHWVPGGGLHPASVETAEPQAGWHGECATVANLMATVGKVQRERQHAVHIARHDPARVLREVKAKRRILERHSPVLTYGSRACDGCGWDREDGHHVEDIEECPELRDMASVYADHPDYEQSWSVE